MKQKCLQFPPPQEAAFEGGFPVGALTVEEGGMWGAGEDSHPAKH